MPTTPPPPPPPPLPPLPKKDSSMLTSNKKRTLSVKSNLEFQSASSLAQVSTSNQDLKPYWNGQVAEWSQNLWLPTINDSASSSSTYSPPILQNTWFSSTMRSPTNSDFPNIQLSSAECKKEELLTDKVVKTGEKKGKISTIMSRKKRKCSEATLNRTLQVKVYPNHPQKQLLKRWMGLSRFAYNTVIRWNRRCLYTTTTTGQKELTWIKFQPYKDKLQLFADIRANKDANSNEDTKLQKAAIWGDRKFLRAVVHLGMLFRGTHGIAPANIIDEAIDEALVARGEVIKRNTTNQGSKSHTLSFRSCKDLQHTIVIRSQNFSKLYWDRFYVSLLHTKEIYTYKHRYKDKHPLHFEKKRKKNKWPNPHKIMCDGKLTYSRKTNEWKFAWVYRIEKQHRETQADNSIHAVSIDPGVRTPFTWYSPTKGVGKIGEHDIGRIVRLCTYMDKLISQQSKFSRSTSKRKKNKAKRLSKAVACIRRKIFYLQSEIHKKAASFFTREFDAIIIPPFEVSNMINRKTRKIKRKTVQQMLSWAHYKFRQRLIAKAEELGVRVIIQNEAYTSKTCSWCGNIQKIGGSEVYNCQNCGTVMDRDENGARGIFLRALLDGALILSGDSCRK